MKTRLFHIYDALTSSYWFVPSAMAAGALLLAAAALWLDVRSAGDGWPFLYGGGPEEARSLLSTLASSAITVAGVVFSITIVALTQASSQFGPRLLRTFMRDTGNQLVLGTFVATFLYCLLVLRTVRSGEDPPGSQGFVPHLAVTMALVLATASIGLLVYYIHHISSMLQAPLLVAAVGAELDQALSRICHTHLGQGPPTPDSGETEPNRPEPAEHEARAVESAGSGYLQAVDHETLMSLATDRDLLVRLSCRPGDYAIEGGTLLLAWPRERVGADEVRRLRSVFLLGPQRTAEQDVEYSINQIVEIAVRAVSASVNDPFTAITCLDWLGSAVARLARSELPGPYRHDRTGRLRVITPVSSFAGVADAAFNQIRQYGHTSVAVVIHMLDVIQVLAGQLRSDEQRRVLGLHAALVYGQGSRAAKEESDRSEIGRRYEETLAALERRADRDAGADPAIARR